MRWRSALRTIHRDLGYFLTALVCIYSISGLAVNHIEDFNPNYAMENRQIDLGPLGAGDLDTSWSGCSWSRNGGLARCRGGRLGDGGTR